MLLFFEQKGKDKGYPEFVVWVMEENSQARDFYEKNNYCSDGREKIFKRWNKREIRYINRDVVEKKERREGSGKMITRNDAYELLKKYNKDPFHIQHALTVEAVMKWYAKELGYADEEEYWGIVGLLHDIDFELYPEEHCLKAPELLKDGGVSDDIIHAVCSHGYGITVGCGVTIDVEPVHEMEKVLFAADELTGLIWAAALMRPSKST